VIAASLTALAAVGLDAGPVIRLPTGSLIQRRASPAQTQ